MSDPKPYAKVASFTKAPGIAQVASYITFTLEVVLFYSVILPNLNYISQISLGILFSLSLLCLVCSACICSSVDPADTAMVLYRNDRQKFEELRSNHEGRLLFCDYCSSYVKEKSRHCRVCDRCVQNFDHHCMWINNCVGGLNYKSFFAMIIAAFAHLLIYVIAIAILTYQSEYSSYLGGFIVGWISGSVNSIFAFLLFNLIMLHIYLQCKGFSTYEFIMAQREEERLKKEAEQNKKLGSESQKVVYPQAETRQRGEQQSNISLVEGKRKRLQMQNQENISEQKVDSKVIRIRSESSSCNSEGKEQEVIFGEKEVTHKSENMSESQHSRQESESEVSIKVSQLFTRNKSLKLIIGNNEYYKPHPQRSSAQSKPKIKAYSMMT